MEWSAVRARLSVGQKVSGLVVHHIPPGIFLDLEPTLGESGWMGLIELIDFPREAIGPGIAFPAIGSQLDAWVLGFYDKREDIRLTLIDPAQRPLRALPQVLIVGTGGFNPDRLPASAAELNDRVGVQEER